MESLVSLKDPCDRYMWVLNACGMILQGENKKQLNNISNFLKRNHCSPWSVIRSLFEPQFYPGNPGISSKLLCDTMQKFLLFMFYQKNNSAKDLVLVLLMGKNLLKNRDKW